MTVKAVSAKSVTTHFVKIGSFSGSLQIAHYNSSSTSLTKSSSYPPSEGLLQLPPFSRKLRKKWKKWNLMIMRSCCSWWWRSATLQYCLIWLRCYFSEEASRDDRSLTSILGWFNNRTGTSVDDGARKSNRLPDQWQSGKLTTGSSVQSFPRAFPSSTDVPVLLLDQPINN